MVRFPNLNAAEVATVGESENAAIEFEGDVDVNAGTGLIGEFREFLRVGEPEKLSIEFEMESDDGARKLEPKIFSLAADGEDYLILSGANEGRGRLRFCGDGVEDMDAANAAALDEGAKSSRDRLYFR